MKISKLFFGIVLGLIFLTKFLHATGDDTANDMKKLVNYHKMNKRHYATYKKQREAQFVSWQKNQIPKRFQIPIEMQSFRDDYSTRYYVIYSPSYKTGVGYIPSNLVQYYEEEAWAAYQKLGADAPSLSIVLAQQFTESAFNPQAIGDEKMSIGLPQLYRKTAKLLYKTDRETWKEYFYFDKKGRHHFKSNRAMVKFPFVFLGKVKNYDFEHKFEGIKSYNGAGEEAIKYAEKVMKRSLFYEELFAQYNSIPLDTTQFKENLYGMINLTFIAREESPIDHELMDQIFANALAEFYSGYVRTTYLQHYQIPAYENQPMFAQQKEDYLIPVDDKDYYLIVEDGEVVYNYFINSEELLKTINHPKNKEFYLYYVENKKRVRITSFKSVGKKQIYSNVKAGDKIFIPPGTIIKTPKANLAVMIR
ncbi:MAG: hypothetical protein WCX31_06745 [Salinivirgaceae bacterium]